MEVVQTEADGRAPTRRNTCYQQDLSSSIYSLVSQILTRIPESLVVKACENTTSTETVQAPNFLTVRYVSTRTALVQVMLLTFKPFYWCFSICKVPEWWLKMLFTEHQYLAVKLLSWLMQYTGTCLSRAERRENRRETRGAKTAEKGKSPNLWIYSIKNSNSMLSAGLMNCKILRKANGRAGHEQTKS